MGGRRPHLTLAPELCDRCGACLASCPEGALKVGQGYIFVEWERCGDCTACAAACDRGAISPKGARSAGPSAASEDVRTRSAAPALREGAVTTVPHTTEERRARVVSPGASDWSIREVAAVLAVAIALLAAKDAVLGSDAAQELSLQGLVALRAAAQSINYGALLSLLLWMAHRRGVRFGQAFGLVRPSRVAGSIAWVVAALLSVRLIATMYGEVAQAIGWTPPARAGADLTSWFGADVFGLVLATLTVVVLGPFVEEVVFRGMVLPVLERRVDRWLAIGASALLFAASHLTLWSFVPLAVLGAALGWLATSRRSIWPSVALHSLYNAVAVLAAFYVAGTVGG